jgi:hypothetical protein
LPERDCNHEDQTHANTAAADFQNGWWTRGAKKGMRERVVKSLGFYQPDSFE